MDLLNEIPTTPPLAQKRTRFFAAFIDFIILMLGCYTIAHFAGQTYNEDGQVGFNLTGLPAFIALFFAFLLLPVNEGLTGQTIGKRLFKIQVVKNDLTKISLADSIIRHLLDAVDCFLLIGLIVAGTNPNKQRIGDLVAKTLVVVKR
jgi:uncharacterized RDD family membrane protein YckC